jgi:membrane-bound metal-dependent hydrolase YbcI (DUF457 family)
MGNYRQHLTFAWILGVGYAVASFLLMGIHWLYGTVAILLSTMSGLLPDLDSDSSVQMRGFTGLLGVLVAVSVWNELGRMDPPPLFEVHLWCVVLSYVMVRHFVRRIMAKLTVHRGICHSVPTCGVWGMLAYLYYPSPYHLVKLSMGLAVATGFLSHLILDEMCSVDLQGVRVNKAFGTALKFWSDSLLGTLFIYGILSLLTYKAIQDWPDGSLAEIFQEKVPSPKIQVNSNSAVARMVRGWLEAAFPEQKAPAK